MKKIIAIFLATILTTTYISCNSDDDSSNPIELNGTTWVGTGQTIPERSFTFTSDSEYTYMEPGGGSSGTYTFNNNQGIITDSFGTVPFSLNNEILIFNYDEGTGGYIDTTGQGTYIKL